MNLIEQLGGYEAAKAKRVGINNTLENSEFLGGGSAREGLYERLDSIEQALLEYRRQHNIFEVGDKVVLKNSRFGSCNDSVYDVVKINKTHLLYELDCGWCGYSHYLQHANDAEIKAGRRL